MYISLITYPQNENMETNNYQIVPHFSRNSFGTSTSSSQPLLVKWVKVNVYEKIYKV